MISSWHTKQNKEIELIQSELALQEVGPNIENIVRTGSQAVRYSIKSEWANIGSLDNESKKAETNSEDGKPQSSTSIPNSQSQNKSRYFRSLFCAFKNSLDPHVHVHVLVLTVGTMYNVLIVLNNFFIVWFQKKKVWLLIRNHTHQKQMKLGSQKMF